MELLPHWEPEATAEFITKLVEPGGKKARSPSARGQGLEMGHFQGSAGLFLSEACLPLCSKSHSPRRHARLEAEVPKKGENESLTLTFKKNKISRVS